MYEVPIGSFGEKKFGPYGLCPEVFSHCAAVHKVYGHLGSLLNKLDSN